MQILVALDGRVCIVVDHHHQNILPLSPDCELSSSTPEIACNPSSSMLHLQLFGILEMSVKIVLNSKHSCGVAFGLQAYDEHFRMSEKNYTKYVD